MSYLRDAIMESNQLEDEVRFQKAKNPPELKGRKKQEIKECGNAPAEDIQEGIVKDTIGAVGDVANKVSKVCDVISEDAKPLKENADFVNIEDIISDDAYTESLQKIAEEKKQADDEARRIERKNNVKKFVEDRKQKRIASYRRIANLDESTEITEDNLDNRAFNWTCMWESVSPERLRADLLNQEYTASERI